jgi:hypothetical protein
LERQPTNTSEFTGKLHQVLTMTPEAQRVVENIELEALAVGRLAEGDVENAQQPAPEDHAEGSDGMLDGKFDHELLGIGFQPVSATLGGGR